MTTKLYRYQKEGVNLIEEFNGRALLADEMGLGKTIQALWWADNYLDRTDTILVICPASIKWNWQREAAHHCNIRAEVLSGMTAPDQLSDARIYIINYDILTNRRNPSRSWLNVLQQLRPTLVIADECHYIKSPRALRTKAVRKICKLAPHVIMISGTPLTNRPAELFPALNILYPDIFRSFMDYAWRYCDPKRKPWGMEFKGATNLDELHERLNELCMIRRRKKDVLTQLPDKTRNVVPMELDKKDYAEYRKAEIDFVTWLRKISPVKARSAKRAEYLVRRGYLKRLAGTMKLRQVTEWVENFLADTDEKLILFGVHKKFLGPLRKHFSSECVFVDGSVCGKDRQRAFDSFTKNNKKRLLIGNIQAAGVGWNGQVASHVAFGEMGWTPGEHTQAEDRTHRISQTKPVFCHYLVSRNTIEEDLCRIIQEKQKVLTNVLDGTKEIELDVMIQLEKKLLARVK